MISIKRGEEYYLGKNKGNKILDIKFLGIGGAFDIEEGSSSVLFETKSNEKFLIDCGHSSYEYLKKKNKVNDINKIFITHMHSDHVNGLSTLIYDRYYIHNLQTVIECTPEVGEKLKLYLNICGHPEDQFIINTDNHVFIEKDGISVTKIDTTEHHWPFPGFANSGLLFHFDTGDDYAVVIYSGDINVPITDLMNEENYSFVYEKPENVFIFHDMTSLVHEQNPHTNFELLAPVKEQFNNLYTYHHSAEQVALINKSNPKMAATSLIVNGDSFVIEEAREL